jgi:anti-sigma factor RsiW
LGRPLGKHLDNQELNALVPSSCETGPKMAELSSSTVRAARQHAESCLECGGKVSKYRRLVNGHAKTAVPESARPGTDCPTLNGEDWREVAAGLWPQSKAAQLIAHAALCDHCGPLLRRGLSVDNRQEEALQETKPSSRAWSALFRVPSSERPWALARWLAPVAALALIVGVLTTIPSSSRAPFSGKKFAEFAVNTHKRHAGGKLALEVRSSSQQELNQWLKAKSPFSVALPASPVESGEERLYDLQGAQLVRLGDKPAAFIAYQVTMPKLQTAAASLIVTPDSVASASGGIEVDFKKVSFHYLTVDGYKVVTWTAKGLTYALVSEEGNSTQRSCMVCHSAMKDRDLSQTPAPFHREGHISQHIWQ